MARWGAEATCELRKTADAKLFAISGPRRFAGAVAANPSQPPRSPELRLLMRRFGSGRPRVTVGLEVSCVDSTA
jgi:hypothetical protein